MKIKINEGAVNFEDLKSKLKQNFPEYEYIERKNFLGKYLVIKKTTTVGATVQIRKDCITIYGAIPSIWIQAFFGGLLLYVFIRSQLNEMETRIGDFVKRITKKKINKQF